MTEPALSTPPAEAPDSAEFTSITLRLPADLKERIEARAIAEERTVSQWVRYYIKEMLDSQS